MAAPTAPKTASAEASSAIKTNPYDALSVKHLLDDTAIDLVRTDRKFSEDYSFSNRKLIVGGAACALAITSHFAPIPYPYALLCHRFFYSFYVIFYISFELSRWKRALSS